RVDGEIDQQTNALTIVVPAVTVDPSVATVNGTVTFEIANFPPNSAVSITWRRLSGSVIVLDPVTTDATGAASGTLRVPATPGGTGQVVTFASGSVSEQVSLQVKPRVK